jgi:hypothetical protein
LFREIPQVSIINALNAMMILIGYCGWVVCWFVGLVVFINGLGVLFCCMGLGGDWLVFVVLGLGGFVEAFVYSVGYVAVSWVFVPRFFVGLLAVWSPLWLLVGGVVFGFLSDLFGRRGVLFLSFVLYLVGGVGLVFSGGFGLFLFFLGLLLFAVGGDYNTVLVAMHEYFSGGVRGRFAYLILNFTNLGGVLAGFLALVSLSVFWERLFFGLVVVVGVLLLYLLRFRVPESPRWLVVRGGGVGGASGGVRVVLPSVWFRLVVGVLVGWVYTVGFTLVVLSFGLFYFPGLEVWFVFVYSLVSFVSGVFVGLFFGGLSRRVLLVVSSFGVLLVVLLMAVFVGSLVRVSFLFWLLFVVFSVLINVYFLVEDTLKSEFWVTRRRGSFTGVVRAVSLGGSVPVVFLSSFLPLGLYLWVAVGVFVVGFVVSLVWFLFGVETSGVGVEVWDYGV